MLEYESDPRHLAEYERVVDRELDQREWELDDTRILPKPRKRYRADAAAWSTIRANLERETCYVCGAPWDSLHHVYPRSQGGDDVPVNLAPLCGAGTTGCHGLIEARDREARAKLRHALTQEHVAYLEHKLGAGRGVAWLERNYAMLEAA